MKNILILITKAEVGGAQMSVFNLARKLKEKGFPITVGFGTGTFLADKLKDLNIPTKRFSYLKRTISPYTNIRFIFETKKYIDTHNIDVIHLNSTNTLFAAIAAKLSNNKPNVIFTHRGLSLLDKDYKQSALIRLYAKISFTLLLPLVHHQVFVSKENQTQAQRFSFVKNDTVIYNGLDQQLLKFYPKEQAHEFFEKKIGQSLQNKTIIGSIGRLAYQKNYEFLIKEFLTIKEKYPQTVCLIIGTGPEETRYKELIQKYNLTKDIYLLGNIPEAYRYMKGFNIFVLPSRYEGLSITLLEALFAGIPIISSQVGGAQETIANNSCLYPLNDSIRFQEALNTLIPSKELQEKLGKENKKNSSIFNIDHTVDSYIKLY